MGFVDTSPPLDLDTSVLTLVLDMQQEPPQPQERESAGGIPLVCTPEEFLAVTGTRDAEICYDDRRPTEILAIHERSAAGKRQGQFRVWGDDGTVIFAGTHDDDGWRHGPSANWDKDGALRPTRRVYHHGCVVTDTMTAPPLLDLQGARRKSDDP